MKHLHVACLSELHYVVLLATDANGCLLSVYACVWQGHLKLNNLKLGITVPTLTIFGLVVTLTFALWTSKVEGSINVTHQLKYI